jgi:hypothetical protein
VKLFYVVLLPALALALAPPLGGFQAPAATAPRAVSIPYAEAKPVVDALRSDLLPPDLRSLTASEREASWPAWISAHDSAIRKRLERGDEDSVVNFLLFGTSFTKLERVTERDLAEIAVTTSGPRELIVRRMEDFIAALEAPGNSERLQFARTVLERAGVKLAGPTARSDARRFLDDHLRRMSEEIALLSDRRLNDPTIELPEKLTRFRDRGLSSDTSIFANFAIERALAAIKNEGRLEAGSVRRIAIVGPGLDFTDKHEGYDFYPQQTIQPFAALDSIVRLGLSAPAGVQVMTFDLSTRINRHLEGARERARAGTGYLLALPRTLDPPWTSDLVAFWQHLGEKIGSDVKTISVPPALGNVAVRAVQVRPDVVLSLTPVDLNLVLQRVEPADNAERFDLIIATNVLVYYDVFEQSLALANVAKMLRSGGLLLTNNALFELPPIPMEWVGNLDVTYMNLPGIGEMIDRMFWYRRE